MSDERLTEAEMIGILEGLARNSNSATAQIQAIKVLREMRGGDSKPADGFAALDGATAGAASRAGVRLKAV